MSTSSAQLHAVRSEADSAVQLLRADTDFARAVPEADRALADRTLTLRERTVDAGDVLACDPREAVALLVLGGVLWREVRVGAGGAPQLIGAGGVLLCDPADGELVPVTVTTTALVPTRVALLDRRFLMASTRWPRLTSILHARLAQQERDLGIVAAIGQLPRVDERLLALLWHLAERWGRVGADGVHVPLRLTHATLGRFVGARRPTVSLALAQLRDAGRVARRDDGTWTLLGDPPSASAAPDAVVSIGPPADLIPAGSRP